MEQYYQPPRVKRGGAILNLGYTFGEEKGGWKIDIFIGILSIFIPLLGLGYTFGEEKGG